MLNEVVRPLLEIQGSYLGMLQGEWPLHLLAKSRLPERLSIPDTWLRRSQWVVETLLSIHGQTRQIPTANGALRAARFAMHEIQSRAARVR